MLLKSLYESVFIVHVTVKGLLKSYTGTKMKHLSYKSECGTHIPSLYKNATFHVSVLIRK